MTDERTGRDRAHADNDGDSRATRPRTEPTERQAGTTTAWITRTVDSLERHEGQMTDRERALCTTLLHGLAAAGQLSHAGQPAEADEDPARRRRLTEKLRAAADKLEAALDKPEETR